MDSVAGRGSVGQTSVSLPPAHSDSDYRSHLVSRNPYSAPADRPRLGNIRSCGNMEGQFRMSLDTRSGQAVV